MRAGWGEEDVELRAFIARGDPRLIVGAAHDRDEVAERTSRLVARDAFVLALDLRLCSAAHLRGVPRADGRDHDEG